MLGQVVEASQVEKFNPYESLFSRPGTQMGMAGYAPYGMIPSRPPSGNKQNIEPKTPSILKSGRMKGSSNFQHLSND